jgi:integrase
VGHRPQLSWNHGPTTYQGLLDASVIPTLGAVELQRLTPGHLSVLYRELLTSGRRHRPGGLAPKTVRNVHVLIHRVLKDAVRWGYVVRNVADAADPPKVKPTELQVWSPGQLRAFLAHVQVDRQYAAWLLAATTGMRRGELLGCVGSTSTWTLPASLSASRGWLPTTPCMSPSRRRPGAGGRSRSTR